MINQLELHTVHSKSTINEDAYIAIEFDCDTGEEKNQQNEHFSN